MAADVPSEAEGDPAAIGCAAKYAGVRAQPALERSELYARNERRRQSDTARLEPPARGRCA